MTRSADSGYSPLSLDASCDNISTDLPSALRSLCINTSCTVMIQAW